MWIAPNVVNVVDRPRWSMPTLALVLTEEERKQRLAYWIRDTMDRRRLTPPKVATVVGVSRSTVTAWAAGRQAPSMIYLGPLATALSPWSGFMVDLNVDGYAIVYKVADHGAAVELTYLYEMPGSKADRPQRRGPYKPM